MLVSSTLLLLLATQPQASAPISCASTIGMEQDSKVVNVHVGDTVSVRLAAQLGTGYTWRLQPAETKVVVLPSSPSTESSRDSMPGSAETLVFPLRIVSAGDVVLHFRYLRPWEKSHSPAKTFQVTLHALANCS